MDGWTVSGAIATFIGLGTTIYVAIVARGAREAAQAARALARRRNLVEELESASQKIQQVGQLIQHEEWIAVRMRTDELIGACRIVLTRWPDQLSEERRNEMMTASRLLSSIALVVSDPQDGELSVRQKRKINDAHLTATGHISSALGEARRDEERDGELDNAN